MNLSTQQLAAALDAIAEDIERAAGAFEDHYHSGDPWELGIAGWRLKLAYTKLSVLCEVLQLPLLRADIASSAEAAERDWTASVQDPNGEPHLKWAADARRVHVALQTIFLTESSQTVTKDLEAIVRDSLYTISDPRIYGAPPAKEADVHTRIQGILRCVFPDLLNKPTLTKPIKNFEPDTGIPSIQTIIEYKFVSDRSQVPIVADQILADTRGYTSDKWQAFLYVIYETERFKSEIEWRQFLRECGNAENVSAIVLSGGSLRRADGKRRKPIQRVDNTTARTRK